jgi:hypothetical protein
MEFGACEPEWLDWVRSPTQNDMRDRNWQPLDILDIIIEQWQIALISKITLAFQNTKLENGITIHQARALDDYQ